MMRMTAIDLTPGRACRIVPCFVMAAGIVAATAATAGAQARPAEPAGRPAPAPAASRVESRRWQPADPIDGPPYTTVKAWAIADGRTGEVLWGHREAEPLEPASTTKIMTALVVARLIAADPKVGDEMVTFSRRADRTIGSSAEVREGERLTVRELLYGLLLPSGNDAAVAFAEHFGGRLKGAPDAPKAGDAFARFIAEMNRVAGELGLRETHFENPNGLPAPTHRSSARDLARLARKALAEPSLAPVVATRKHACTLVDGAGKTREVVWTNTNRLLDIDGFDGVKTGTTQAAGTCLVASGRRGDDRLIVVVLGGSSSPDSRYPDTRNLFRWAWQMRQKTSATADTSSP